MQGINLMGLDSGAMLMFGGHYWERPDGFTDSDIWKLENDNWTVIGQLQAVKI